LDAATRQHPVRQGQEGDSVRQVQEDLSRRGFQVKVDGKFGPETEAAVRQFQAQNGCKVDGMVGPETLGAMRRGASTEPAGQRTQRQRSGEAVGSGGAPRAPTEADRARTPDGGVRAGDLQRTNPATPAATGSAGSGGDITARGTAGRTTLSNGTTVSGPTGQVTVGRDGYVKADGTLGRAERDGVFIDVGRVSAESGRGTRRIEGTAIEASTGDSNALDVGSRIGDAGAEATFRATRDEGRIGAGYRANIAEVNVAGGSVSSASTNDHREQVRVSVGAPSGGAFVSWNDRDRDGARNYRLDVDVPIPGTPLGVGISLETESPIRDGIALVASFNPVTAPIAGAYRLGRMCKFW
jgi:peptidoglycan hydrolase-like protein with peptidoglycan-binding domain